MQGGLDGVGFRERWSILNYNWKTIEKLSSYQDNDAQWELGNVLVCTAIKFYTTSEISY